MRNLGLDRAVVERCHARLARTEKMLQRRYGVRKSPAR
jgi:hypothetical protein